MASPDVHLPPFELDVGLVGDSSSVRTLFGGRVNESASDRSNMPPAALPREPLGEPAEEKAADKAGGELSPEEVLKPQLAAPLGVQGNRPGLAFLSRSRHRRVLKLHRQIWNSLHSPRRRVIDPTPPLVPQCLVVRVSVDDGPQSWLCGDGGLSFLLGDRPV